MTRDLSNDLELLRQLADQAGKMGREKFRSHRVLNNKAASGFDPVTEADQEIEALIRSGLAAHRPQDTILGEEGDDHEGSSDWSWIIDPIDGTRAFIAGLPTWCTLIALSHERRPVLSVIVQPFTRETFFGLCSDKENRAWHEHDGNVQTLKASRQIDLGRSILTTTDPDLFVDEERRCFDAIATRAQLVRYGLDAYGYAALALGGVDVVVESGLKPWDMAALIPVVKGAGGSITSWSGHDPMSTGQLIASASDELHASCLEQLGPASA